MAEMDTSGGGGRHQGKVKAKKKDIHVDMTPMVDLAFLLITFFMLTTTMSQPVAMQLAVPKPPDKDKIEETSEAVKESQVLTIIMDKDDIIWYYEGLPQDLKSNDLQRTAYGADGIRQVILDKKQKVLQRFREPDKTICLLKSTSEARYKNIVDILDEMDITGIKIFALQDLLPHEIQAVAGKWNASSTQ
ncbi:MAG: biopolymer transporter ExbD [Chitinophagales bacterium]|nr:biopolymer transporter ExbD [Chitinophagales bacterium]